MTEKDRTIKKLADSVERLTKVVEKLEGKQDPTDVIGKLQEIAQELTKHKPGTCLQPYYSQPRDYVWTDGCTIRLGAGCG
jgi:hypothetical protein